MDGQYVKLPTSSCKVFGRSVIVLEVETAFLAGYAGKHNLAPVYDYLARRIRSVDKNKFIFFEGVTWSVLAASSNDGFAGPGFEHVPGGSADPQEFRRSVFSYHYYCPLIELANTSLNFSFFTRLICDEVGPEVKA